MENHLHILPKLEGHGGCFASFVFVLCENGKKPISLVQTGDFVIAFDDRGVLHKAKVLEKICHENQEVWIYSFWGGKSLVCTPNHLVLNQYGAFVTVHSLEKEDCVCDKHMHLRPFLSKERLPNQTVYNLVVENFHTFVANDLCVHNGGINLFDLPPLEGRKGGKGGGGSAPFTEAPNTLQSNSLAKMLELVSAGPVWGLVDGAKSIFFDKTPLQNKDGSYNFSGVQWEFRNGEEDQEIIKGFETIRTEVSVGAEITKQNPAVRRIVLSGETGINLRLSLPRGLMRQDPNSNSLVGDYVDIVAEFSYNNGPYKQVGTYHIEGKTDSAFEETFYAPLEQADFVDIRLSRVQEDSNTALLQNATSWSAYTLLSGYKLNYPGMAVVSYFVNARDFANQIPSRTLHVRGLILEVPSNYNPETRTYSGIWDGTFKNAYSNNPAWVLWYLLTNGENGLGEDVPEWALALTKPSLYKIARYCDEPVSDGYGGFEPRFTFNGQLVEQKNALEYLRLIVSSFNVMVFYSNQSIHFTQQCPQDRARIFNKANVIDGEFLYAEADLSSMHTVVSCSFNNNDNFGISETEVAEDPEGILERGIVKKDIQLIGCTSRGQAKRIARHTLLLEKLSQFTLTFKIGLAECDILPGQIIGIYDEDFAECHYAGRIRSWKKNGVVLDRPFVFEKDREYFLELTLSDGTLDKIKIINPNRETAELVLEREPKTVLANCAVYGIWSNSLVPQEYMVLSVAEESKVSFSVCAVKYDQRIFDMVEKDIVLPKPPESTIPSGPLPCPSDLNVREYIYALQQKVYSGALFSWKAPDDIRVAFYEVQIKSPLSPIFEEYGLQSTVSLDIKDTIKGLYVFRVRAVSALGLKSVWAEYSHFMLGLEQPLPDVTGFSTVYKSGKLYFVWDEVTDLRSFSYEIRMGLSWEEGMKICTTKLLEYPVRTDGTYFIKAVFGEAESVNPDTLEVEGVGQLVQNVIARFDERADNWNGSKDDFWVTENNDLLLATGCDFWKVEDLWTEEDIYFAGYSGEEGIYYPKEEKDITLAVNYLCNVVYRIKGYAVSRNGDFYNIADIWTCEDIYGLVDRGWYIKVDILLRRNGVWEQNWKELNAGEYLADGFRFRLRAKADKDTLVYIEEFKVSVDVPDRREYYKNVFIPEEGLLFQFKIPFNAAPTVVATILDATGNEDVVLEDSLVTKESVFIRVADKQGQPAEKFINFLAEGY